MSSYSKGSELLFKILIIGEGGTGKTCLIRRYVHSIFLATNKATIGVDFALKDIVHSQSNRNITLQLWDIAGQERYGQMTRVYYQAAAGAVVVADITRPETLEMAVKWKRDVDSKVFIGATGKPIPSILLINKLDLLPNGILATSSSSSSNGTGNYSGTAGSDEGINKTKEEMDAFCREHGFETWFVTSAKEDKNVDTAFQELVEYLLKSSNANGENDAAAAAGGSNNDAGNGARILQNNRQKREGKSGCSC